MNTDMQSLANLAQVLALPVTVFALILQILSYLNPNPDRQSLAAFLRRIRPLLAMIIVAGLGFWLGTKAQPDAQGTTSPQNNPQPTLGPTVQLAQSVSPPMASGTPCAASGTAMPAIEATMESYRVGYRATVESASKELTTATPSAKLYLERGKAFYYLNQHDDAIADFSRVTKLPASSTELVDAYLTRGLIYQDSKQNWALAIDNYTAAFQITDTIDGWYYVKRAECYVQLSQNELALKDLDIAVQRSAQTSYILANAADTYLTAKAYDQAITTYGAVITLDPLRSFNYQRRAEAYLQKKDYDNAIKDLTEAIQLEPEDDNVYLMRARVRVAAGDNAGAMTDYQKVIELNKFNKSTAETELQALLKVTPLPNEGPG